MRFLSHTCILVVNIFIVFISFLLFSISSNTFETIVIAILILIYAEVRISRTASHGYYLHQILEMKFFKNPNYWPESGEDPREEFKTITNLVFMFILYLLAVWKILNSIINFV